MKAGAVAVAETTDEVEANIFADALRDAGMRAEVIRRGVGAALGGAVAFPATAYHVVVEPGSLEAARNVIADLGGSRRLLPVPGESGDPMRIVWLLGAVIVAFLGLGLLVRLLAG